MKRANTMKQIRYLLIAWLMLQLPVANADCTFDNGSVSLGTAGSFDTYNGPVSSKGYTGFSCRGLALNLGLLQYNYINANILSTTNNMLLKNVDGSGDAIP